MSVSEIRAANRLMIQAICLAASYTLMRAVGDGLFLSRIGSDLLAEIFVVSGVATAILATIWYAISRNLSLDSSLRISGCVAASITLGAWAALPQFGDQWWLLAGIYLLAELKGCVNAINVVSAMNEVLGGHCSRHAWARIGLGAPLAAVTIGLLLGVQAGAIDVRTWLLMSAALDLLAILPVKNTAGLAVPKQSISSSAPNPFLVRLGNAAQAVQRHAHSDRFRFWIATLIAAKIVVLTLVTFFWKTSVDSYFASDEPSITRYFGFFYAFVGVATLVVQWTLTSRLIARRELHIPVLAMPIFLGLLCVAIVIGGSALIMLIVFTMAKSVDVWRRSVHDTTLNLLYTQVKRKYRRAAISLNTGVIKPLSEVSTSLVLLFGTALLHKAVVVVAVSVWLLAACVLLRLFSEALHRSVSSEQPSPPVKSQTVYSELV